MRFHLIIFLLLLAFHDAYGFQGETYCNQLIQQAKNAGLSKERQWLKLLHYEQGIFGKKSSASSAFFLSNEGHKDPEKELEATLTAFFSTQEREYPSLFENPTTHNYIESQIPRCQFPARYRWLKAKLDINESQLPAVACPQVEKFRKRMGAQTVFVVFSSFNLSGPSSAFGHSLLRMSRNPPGSPDLDQLELLDFGFNFAAEVNVSNPVLYATYGLVGLFRGTYSNIPYYYKVREYNDFESRDLWSYEINLTQEEIDFLIDHIWEVGAIYHPYLYFFRNCSNVILSLIEAAAPQYFISERLKFYIIPPDTIRTLNEVPGLVRRIVYRPSVKSSFDARLKDLSLSSQNYLEHFFNAKYDVKVFQEAFKRSERPVSEQIQLLDTALDYLDFKEAKNLQNQDSPESQKRMDLLAYRAKFHESNETPHLPSPEDRRPDLTHPASKLGVFGGYEENQRSFSQFNIRFSLHDPLDPPIGMPRFSQVEMIGAKFRFIFDPAKFEIEDITAVRILSLSALERFNQSSSWRMDLVGKRYRDQNCDRCFGAEFRGGWGYSVKLTDDWITYGMIEGVSAYAPGFVGSNFRLGMGPGGGFYFMPGGFHSHFGIGTEAFYHYLAFSLVNYEVQMKLELRYNVNQRFSVSALATNQNSILEASSGLSWFF